MSRVIPDQIVRTSVQLEGQCALDSSLPFGRGFFCLFCFSFFEATFIYDRPERLNNGCMGLDSNAIQVRSEEFHTHKK